MFKILVPPKIQFSEKKINKILLACSIFLMKKSEEQVINLEWPKRHYKKNNVSVYTVLLRAEPSFNLNCMFNKNIEEIINIKIVQFYYDLISYNTMMK